MRNLNLFEVGMDLDYIINALMRSIILFNWNGFLSNVLEANAYNAMAKTMELQNHIQELKECF